MENGPEKPRDTRRDVALAVLRGVISAVLHALFDLLIG